MGSALELTWSTYAWSDGAKLRYRDFAVDEIPVGSLLGSSFTHFSRGLPKHAQLEALDRLILAAPADFPKGRVSLYVCYCGDNGCGADSVQIDAWDGLFIWRNFAFENAVEPGVLQGTYDNVGPSSSRKQPTAA